MMAEAEIIERIARAIKADLSGKWPINVSEEEGCARIAATAAYAEVRAMVEEKDAEIARLRLSLERIGTAYGNYDKDDAADEMLDIARQALSKPTLVWTEKGLEER